MGLTGFNLARKNRAALAVQPVELVVEVEPVVKGIAKPAAPKRGRPTKAEAEAKAKAGAK